MHLESQFNIFLYFICYVYDKKVISYVYYIYNYDLIEIHTERTVLLKNLKF